jgi:hypothetical protein
LGLDRWIKPDEKKKKEETEKAPQIKNSSLKTKTVKSEEKPKLALKKYKLICPKAKCKYQRTLVKKRITEKDKLCPKCKTEMKIQK